MMFSRNSVELSDAKIAIDYKIFISYISQMKSRLLNNEESFEAYETQENRQVAWFEDSQRMELTKMIILDAFEVNIVREIDGE